MKCPKCGGTSQVLDSRANESGIRRRRRCEAGHRFTTQEVTLSEWQTKIEEAVDDVMTAVFRAAERARDKRRNRNRA